MKVYGSMYTDEGEIEISASNNLKKVQVQYYISPFKSNNFYINSLS